ncbi:MAG: hypothetical protein R2867_05885 [Caldilineaceae bacterium]
MAICWIPPLLPPSDARTLFSRWEISTTIRPRRWHSPVTPIVQSSQYTDAVAAVGQLANQLRIAADPTITVDWQPVAADRLSVSSAPIQITVGQLTILAPAGGSLASLTTAIPPTADWSLLYTWLHQLQPTVTENAGILNRSVQIRQPIDLQTVGVTWLRLADGLEEQASQLEADAAARNTRDAAEAELALRKRIQAANYRATAQAWRKLTRDSWLILELAVPSGWQDLTRTWQIVPTSPVQVAELASTPSYFAAFMSVLGLGVMVLLFISGLLWWLFVMRAM